ncbi:hypothetical protein [Streptomyces sp. CA-132043]|uniref:hypothetical protein n=1 Tax=Streptomyces sp. CA-132043 TaxID=3240048 RepID=UPI003D9495B1
MNPDRIRYTQDSIARKYKDGRTVDDTIEELKSGKVVADDIPSIRIFEEEGKIYSLDNRRLYAFKKAGVPVRFKRATPAEVSRERWKFKTPNDGTSIKVRGMEK